MSRVNISHGRVNFPPRAENSRGRVGNSRKKRKKVEKKRKKRKVEEKKEKKKKVK